MTFNMGIGYILVVPQEQKSDMLTRLTEAGESAGAIGEVFRGVHEVNLL